MGRFLRSGTLGLLCAVAGCAGSTATPCRSCDAGDDVPLPVDLSPSDGGPRPDVVPVRRDAADGPLLAPRDATAGEAPQATPIPDAGYVFVDDFQSARAPGWDIVGVTDRDASLGGWSVILGSSGSLFAQGVMDQNAWHIAYATTALAPDQIVEARLRIVDFYADQPSAMVGLFARYDASADSGYLLALRGDGSVIVRRRDHGVTASWGPGVAAGITTGVWYTVRLEVIGDAINAFLDERPIYSVTDDAPLPGGGLALGTVGATLETDRVAAAEP